MKSVLVGLLKFYQVAHLPFYQNVCRFEPSCSHYAIGAIQNHGAAKGSWLAFRRVIKCHPFHSGGFDPVPPKESDPC